MSQCACATPSILGPCSFCKVPTGEGLFTVVSQEGCNILGSGRRHAFVHRRCYDLDILAKEDRAVKRSKDNPSNETFKKSATILTKMADLICENL